METKATLDDLPAELILDIGHRLCVHHLNSLVCTAKRFHVLLLTRLYRLGAEVDGDKLPLIWAVENNQLSVVQGLLEQGADPSRKATGGAVALHTAIRLVRVEALRMLLQQPGVDIFVTDKSYLTPLQYAIKHHSAAILQTILDSSPGWTSGQKKYEWATALNMVVRRQNIHFVRCLLEAAARNTPRPAQAAFLSTMAVAARRGDRAIIELLIEFGWDNWGAYEPSRPTPLHQAAENGDEDVVKLMIQHGADVNAGNGFTETPLHMAARVRHLKITQAMLEAGADVSLVDRDQNTVLHLFSIGLRNGEASLDTKPVAELLLNSGADVNAKNVTGNTPLYTAAEEAAELSIIELLVERGADIKATNNQGRTPLYIAAEWSSIATVEFLLARGAHIGAQMSGNKSPLMTAATRNRAHLVQPLIEAGFEPNSGNWTPLLSATKEGHVETMRELIRLGPDINHPAVDTMGGASLIDMALRSRKLEAVKLVLEAGAPITSARCYGRSILHRAILHEAATPEIVQLLIDHGADVHALGPYRRTALHDAVNCGRIELIAPLVAAGVSIDAPDDDDIRALHLAVVSDNKPLELVKTLVKAGADVNSRGFQGTNALHLAVQHGDYETSAWLVNAGADVAARENLGRTALHMCAAQGDKRVLKLLVNVARQISLPLTTQCSNGHTVVEEAAWRGNTHILQLLAADENLDTAGSNPSEHGDHRGIPPLHIAAMYNRSTTVRHLISRGADPLAMDTFGRTAMDWATLYPPANILPLLHRRNFIYTLPGPEARCAVLKESITGLARRMLANDGAVFHKLGKCLQYMDDIPAAGTVFSFGLTPRVCDNCDAYLPLNGTRFVCTRCVEIEMCGDCHTEYTTGTSKMFRACSGHEIAGFDLGEFVLPEQKYYQQGEGLKEEIVVEARRRWLERLIETYSQ